MVNKVIKDVSKQVDIVGYFNTYVYPLDPGTFRRLSGNTRSVVCPLHDDTDPSFHYYKETNSYFCFGCRDFGDVVRLHRRIQQIYHDRQISNEMSAWELVALYGLDIQEEEYEETPQDVYGKLMNSLDVGNLRDVGGKSLVSFRRLNNRVKRMHKAGSYSLEAVIATYAQLDEDFSS